MISSQEEMENSITCIENLFRNKSLEEENYSLLSDFKGFLSDELTFQAKNEETLKENINTLQAMNNNDIKNKYKELQEKFQTSQNYFNKIKKEMSDFAYKSNAEKNILQAKYEQKRQEISLEYNNRITALLKDLEKNKIANMNAEKSLRDEISLEKATKNIRLNNLKVGLQKQILELNNVLTNVRSEHKDLLKELTSLKEEQNTNTADYKKNAVLEFNTPNTELNRNYNTPICNQYSYPKTYTPVIQHEDNVINIQSTGNISSHSIKPYQSNNKNYVSNNPSKMYTPKNHDSNIYDLSCDGDGENVNKNDSISSTNSSKNNKENIIQRKPVLFGNNKGSKRFCNFKK
ncbi:coiled-coil domain-containing protein PF11_0455-like [Sitophilus oryzae]|uniref:Coiled-coil domain-containing protein PF11_0455-like n=1 Tax=Sitophilus oryzae TaxID=7048 RepID=A0A6J2XHJ8_SITOR|nr:coiled-coil domain-containing protein PF11_0455-like [Sitophilus oryzae]